jgi:dsRNA-specific ribonuclease
MIKKVSSTVLLALIAEAYKHDPEGLLSDLQITVDREESLVEFAQSAIDGIEMEDPEEEIEYEEELKRVPALLARQ